MCVCVFVRVCNVFGVCICTCVGVVCVHIHIDMCSSTVICFILFKKNFI